MGAYVSVCICAFMLPHSHSAPAQGFDPTRRVRLALFPQCEHKSPTCEADPTCFFCPSKKVGFNLRAGGDAPDFVNAEDCGLLTELPRKASLIRELGLSLNVVCVCLCACTCVCECVCLYVCVCASVRVSEQL